MALRYPLVIKKHSESRNGFDKNQGLKWLSQALNTMSTGIKKMNTIDGKTLWAGVTGSEGDWVRG